MKEIRNIINLYEKIDWQSEKAALAIVVQVEESAYRRIGARMFVRSTGDWIGGISGGCLEGDALRQAQKAIYREEPSIVVYDTMEDDVHQIGVGLGCNGRIEVLFIPIDKSNQDNPIERLKRIQERRVPSIFYQVLSSENDHGDIKFSYADINNAKEFANQLNISIDELHEKTDLVQNRKKSKVFSFATKEKSTKEVLIEFIRPELKLIIVGDNYDVNAFIGIANELGWEIHIIGLQRKLHQMMLNDTKVVLTYDQVDEVAIDDYTAVVLMSHDFNWDKKMVASLARKGPKYMGMLGPKQRTVKMQKELSDEGVDINILSGDAFYSPVGLDIGAESPEEIALSIAAEIISVFRNRKGGVLRERMGSIHDRDQ